MSALVVGSRSRISNAIVRGLGVSGVEVFTADTAKLTRSGCSKFTSRHFTYRSPLQSEESFFTDLLNIIKISGAEVLLPGDVWLYNYLIKNQDRIGSAIKFVSPNLEQIEQVATKDRLIDLARKMDFLTPLSIVVHSREDLLRKGSGVSFPVIIKPVNEYHGRGIAFASNTEELLSKISGYSSQRQAAGLVVQKFIDGDNYGVGMILGHGEPCAGLCYKQTHQQPVSGGAPTLTESSEFDEPMEILAGILKRLNWHGLCQADFILEKDTGKVYIIDINPRMFGALFTTIAAGINFPYLLYLLSLGRTVEDGFAFKANVKTVWLEGEVKRFLGGCAQIRQLIGSTRVSNYTHGTVIEDWAFHDFKPFLLSPIWYLSHLVSRL